MAILASFPNHNLFSSIPTTSQPPHQPPPSFSPPIPIPKYPPPKPKPKTHHPAFTKTPHNKTKYFKPISTPLPHTILPPSRKQQQPSEFQKSGLGDVRYTQPQKQQLQQPSEGDVRYTQPQKQQLQQPSEGKVGYTQRHKQQLQQPNEGNVRYTQPQKQQLQQSSEGKVKYTQPQKQQMQQPSEGEVRYTQSRKNSHNHNDDRAIIIGESGVSYLLPGAPFEFKFSYSESPKAKPIAIREPPFLPFAPPSMPRPWTGKAPLKSKAQKLAKKNIPLIDSFHPTSHGIKRLEMAKHFEIGDYSYDSRSREEILGEPLSKAEVKAFVKPLFKDNRQINLGRDGLTHNMLELIHSHWKRREVCKVKCKGVPTVDMDNVCKCLEEKTGGKIIHRAGGVVYLFRGRNYNYRTRPRYPVMLWKPAAPVYPKLIQDAPVGLTKEEADEYRRKGTNLLAICKLAKNGVYNNLVNEVREAFEGSELAKIDCEGLDPSDYKRIGAKLMELVPCVLLSFDDEQILMWRGREWKSMYPDAQTFLLTSGATVNGFDDSEKSGEPKTVSSSPRMMSLWKRAIESNKAVLLGEFDLGPDALLERVEEFDRMTQATEHSYPAVVHSGENSMSNSEAKDEVFEYDNDFYDDFIEEGDYDDPDDPFEMTDSPGPLGSLPIDVIVTRLYEHNE